MREAGYQLDKVQRGLEPTDWKPMNSVGRGVREIRIKDDQGIFRVIYITKYLDTILYYMRLKRSRKKRLKKICISPGKGSKP